MLGMVMSLGKISTFLPGLSSQIDSIDCLKMMIIYYLLYLLSKSSNKWRHGLDKLPDKKKNSDAQTLEQVYGYGRR